MGRGNTSNSNMFGKYFEDDYEEDVQHEKNETSKRARTKSVGKGRMNTPKQKKTKRSKLVGAEGMPIRQHQVPALIERFKLVEAGDIWSGIESVMFDHPTLWSITPPSLRFEVNHLQVVPASRVSKSKIFLYDETFFIPLSEASNRNALQRRIFLRFSTARKVNYDIELRVVTPDQFGRNREKHGVIIKQEKRAVHTAVSSDGRIHLELSQTDPTTGEAVHVTHELLGNFRNGSLTLYFTPFVGHTLNLRVRSADSVVPKSFHFLKIDNNKLVRVASDNDSKNRKDNSDNKNYCTASDNELECDSDTEHKLMKEGPIYMDVDGQCLWEEDDQTFSGISTPPFHSHTTLSPVSEPLTDPDPPAAAYRYTSNDGPSDDRLFVVKVEPIDMESESKYDLNFLFDDFTGVCPGPELPHPRFLTAPELSAVDNLLYYDSSFPLMDTDNNFVFFDSCEEL